MLQLGPEATGVPVNVQVESVGDQFEPDTEICTPICAEFGVKIRVGELIVNVVDAVSRFPCPVAVTV